jgi:hypothetical protein
MKKMTIERLIELKCEYVNKTSEHDYSTRSYILGYFTALLDNYIDTCEYNITEYTIRKTLDKVRRDPTV